MYFNEKIWIFTHFFVPVNGYNDKSIGQQSNNTDENVGDQKEVVPFGGNRTIVFVLPYQMMLKVFRTLRLRWWFFLWGHHHDLVLWKNFMNDGDSAEDRGWRNGGCKAHPRERREKKAFLGPHFRGQKPFKKLSVFWTMRCVTNETWECINCSNESIKVIWNFRICNLKQFWKTKIILSFFFYIQWCVLQMLG